MKKFLKIFSLLSLIAVFTTCDNYEFPKSPYPGIETLPVVNISATGVTFQANITRPGNQPMIDHGFVWGLTENITIASDDKIRLGAISTTGNFEANVLSGLTEGKTYYVKAFVSTASYFVYGDAVAFTSKGSTPPIIKSFSPVEGTWGDTVMIEGRYFSSLPKNNLVKFGTLESKVVVSSESMIKCIVPDNIADKTVPIYVTVAGNQAKSATDFVLKTPTIESFSPTQATSEDIITITGTNFSATKEKNVVKFDEHIAEVTESSASQLKVKVPVAIRKRENVVSVTVNKQSTNANDVFTVTPPTISSLSTTEPLVGETIQITGNNFNPTVAGNTVLLEGVLVTISNATKSSITIQLPQGVYKKRSFAIEVVVAEQSAFSQEITLQDTWLRKADVPHGSFGRYDAVAFSIDGMGYVGLGSGGVGDKFWRYNPGENAWTEVAPFPGGQRGGATCFVIGDKAYVGLGGGAPSDFYSYNPQTNSWSRIADFPLESYMARGFSVNGKGYVVRREPTDNFWEYDPMENSWTQLKDIPTGGEYYPHLPDAGFVVDDRLFIYSADVTTAPNQLWEFDFAGNKWIMRIEEEYDSYIATWTSGF